MALVNYGTALIIPSTDRPVHFTLWTLAVSIVLPTILLFVLYRVYGRKAQTFDRVKVLTFANHKGGVGKTTICVFAAKELAKKNPNKNVLVLDCSVFRDLTASVVGDTGFDRPKSESAEANEASIDAARVRLLVVARSWFRSFDPFKFMTNVREFTKDAPENLYVMTNKGETSKEGAKSIDSYQTTSVIANDFRTALNKSGKEWIVIIDTDGGTQHNLTVLGLCMADSVIVPTNVNMNDFRRITVLLDLLAFLQGRGLSSAKVKKLFFNTQTKVQLVAEDEELGLPFTTDDTNRNTIREISTEFERMSQSAKYRAILPPPESFRSKQTVYGGLRDGGVTIRRALKNPFVEKDTNNKPMLSKEVASDLEPLFKDLHHLATRQPLF